MTTLSCSQETDQVFAAFIKAQGEFRHVEKNSDGNRGKFANFPDVVEHVRPVLNNHDLGFTQVSADVDGAAVTHTAIVHTSGQFFMSDGTRIPYAKNDPQGAGSAKSYSKRYDLLATCGVATDDDDGKAAFEGFEREARQRAQVAEAAANRIPQPHVDVLKGIASAVMPDTPDAKLQARYEAVEKDDFEATLRAGLDHAVKAEKIDPGTADDITTAALGGAIDDALKLIAGAS